MTRGGAPARIALAAAALAASASCGTFRELFPPRDEVFIPIPPDIGELRAFGEDTLWVIAGPGWEARAKRQEPLVDAERILEDASRRWQRIFAAEPPARLIIRLEPRRRDSGSDRRRAAADSATFYALDSSLTFPYFVSPRDARQVAVSRSLGRVIADRWLRHRATEISGVKPVADSGRTGHPALPDWIESALAARISGTGDPLFARRHLASLDSARLIPLPRLVGMTRPERQRRESGYRRGPGGNVILDSLALFELHAAAVAEYLADQEGEEFLGWLADELARGRTMAQALATAASAPRTIEAAGRGFLDWLAAPQH